jgi:hypothetical protein
MGNAPKMAFIRRAGGLLQSRYLQTKANRSKMAAVDFGPCSRHRMGLNHRCILYERLPIWTSKNPHRLAFSSSSLDQPFLHFELHF